VVPGILPGTAGQREMMCLATSALSAFKGQYKFLLVCECEYNLKAKSENTIYLEEIL
jgi:hypothetical protein